MPRGMQISVYLKNEPGMLAKVTGALRARKVNIRAISVVDSADACIVRLVVANPAAARKALSRYGATLQHVLVLEMTDEVGRLDAVASKLARAGVNIQYVYGSAAGARKRSVIVFGVSDLAKAIKTVG